MNLERLKTEFVRNKTKSLVLGGLMLVLACVSVNMLLSGSPRSASASVSPKEIAVSAETNKTGEMDAKVHEAEALWETMRTKRGVTPAAAFEFTPERYEYPRDPLYRAPTANLAETQPSPTPAVPQEMSADQREQLRREQIKQESGQLVLQAILMGDQPTVLINSKRFGLGEEINGFKISVVEDRLVRVVKDGVEVVIPLKDSAGIKK